LGASGFRQINNHLTARLLTMAPLNAITVAFIDATDLPANTTFKKNEWVLDGATGNLGSAFAAAG
jgi:hypothetical protein